MEKKYPEVKVFKIKVLHLKNFLEKYILKADNINGRKIQKNFKYLIYPRVSKMFSGRRLINIEHSRMGGIHCTCFHIKDNISFFFDSFGGQFDTFLLQQLQKPRIYHFFKNQVINI